jgi:SAM-dependent methyltransferase
MAERQEARNLDEIRQDHRGRYAFAMAYVEGKVLDAACGTGYGSFMMAQSHQVDLITGVDISGHAIAFAKDAWPHEKINWICNHAAWVDCLDYDWCINFETLEYVEDPEALLRNFRGCRNMICSVPNEDAIPFCKQRFPYHYRHYTPTQFELMLVNTGWKITEKFGQPGLYSEDLEPGFDGRTMIAVCERIKTG